MLTESLRLNDRHLAYVIAPLNPNMAVIANERVLEVV
jgi:hypothetical protein